MSRNRCLNRVKRVCDARAHGRSKVFVNNGFTLLEVLVVVAILTTLMTLSLPAMMAARDRSNLQATQAMIDTVKAMIVTDAGSDASVFIRFRDENDNEVISYKWDFNQDGYLDGDPDKDFDAEWQANAERAFPTGYAGFIGALGGSFGDTYIEPETGIVYDSWATRIKIDFDPTEFGAIGFRIRSAGPDGLWDTADDLTTEQRGGIQ